MGESEHTLVFAVVDAYQEFLLDKQAQQVRPRTVTDYRSRVGRLAKKYPAKMVSEITAADVKALIALPGSYSMTPSHFERVPDALTSKVISENK